MTKVYKKIMICLLLLVCYGMAYGQTNVTGVVKGADDGSTLPGVSVSVKGTTKGVISDVDGKFSLSVPANAVLQFSFIGYITKEVAVNGKSVINVSLQVS